MWDLSVTKGRGTALPSTTDGKETQNFYQESWQLPHSWPFCNNKISNMLPTFNKCYVSEFPTPCPHPNMANILEKEAIIIFIFFFILIIKKGYKTGHWLPGNFLCLRIGLFLPWSGEKCQVPGMTQLTVELLPLHQEIVSPWGLQTPFKLSLSTF